MPVLEKPSRGTRITLLGTGRELRWYWLAGKLHIRTGSFSAREIAALKSAWVFKIG